MATNQVDSALDELNGNVTTRSSEVFLVRHAGKISNEKPKHKTQKAVVYTFIYRDFADFVSLACARSFCKNVPSALRFSL